ncbi:MAG: sigma-54 interaction domain-containing protein [Bacteroidales bacterium]
MSGADQGTRPAGPAAQQLIGVSAAIRAVQDEMQFAARSDAKVLITGESGVGKEVVARLIHQQSVRHAAPLVTINCAGLPDTLLESELFGHVRGSFTGAYRDRPGLLETADRGTVFMDEVGEMSIRMQALLLRFLESGEVQRVGSDRTQGRVDVRVIAATNRNLVDRIASREFREDLYYRLNVIQLYIPPLRERRDDIEVLLPYYLRAYSQRHGVPVPELAPEATRLLLAYDWPGNVRELKNVTERLVVRARALVVGPDELPPEVTGRTRAERDRGVPVRASVAEAMYERMVRAHESFWSVVYPPFIARDLTREDLRLVVRKGLEQARGNYKLLVQLFNMPPTDYKRFLNFLRKHDCHMPFQRFRSAAVAARADAPEEPAETF